MKALVLFLTLKSLHTTMPKGKLTKSQVIEIYELSATHTLEELSKLVEVRQSTLFEILKGKSYKKWFKEFYSTIDIPQLDAERYFYNTKGYYYKTKTKNSTIIHISVDDVIINLNFRTDKFSINYNTKTKGERITYQEFILLLTTKRDLLQ